MRWLVDGYNVIRRDPELQAREAESLEAGRRALLNLIARARRAMQDEFTVVFDGARISGAAPTAGRIRVVFSRPPLTADDEIMRLARQLRSGAVVVSSDRKIQDAARRAGSAVLTPSNFWKRWRFRKVGRDPPIKGRFRRGAGSGEARQPPPSFQESATGSKGPRTPPPTLTLARVSWRIAVWQS
jgi:predicted RNA-binding protein with PIN domain